MLKSNLQVTILGLIYVFIGRDLFRVSQDFKLPEVNFQLKCSYFQLDLYVDIKRWMDILS